MRPEDLFERIGAVDEEILERSQSNKRMREPRMPRWMWRAAAVLAIMVMGEILVMARSETPHSDKVLPQNQIASEPAFHTAYAIAQAKYPEMAQYPDENAKTFKQDYAAWQMTLDAQRQPEDYAEGTKPFLTAYIPRLLSEGKGENRACSPLNAYMALGMLAELTGGNSRQQILDALGTENLEALRIQAQAIWNGQYRNDGAVTSILASSVWLDESIPFSQEVLDTLAQTYYASSFKGEMSSPAFEQAMQRWINAQTGGLLKNQVQEIKIEPQSIMHILTTICFRAKWDTGFDPAETRQRIFYSEEGEVSCDFMHSTEYNAAYFWADHFGAVRKPLKEGGAMWFLLPDEGISAETLLDDPQLSEFLLAGEAWQDQKDLIVHIALPKFDLISQMDLRSSLQKMGITDLFDAAAADFTPITPDGSGQMISKIQHDVRVMIDEEGVSAAAYTAMGMDGAGKPPEQEMEFVLDRPFLFAVTSADALPLFVGVVHTPNQQ